MSTTGPVRPRELVIMFSYRWASAEPEGNWQQRTIQTLRFPADAQVPLPQVGDRVELWWPDEAAQDVGDSLTYQVVVRKWQYPTPDEPEDDIYLNCHVRAILFDEDRRETEAWSNVSPEELIAHWTQ